MCRDSRMWWPELGVILFWPQFYETSLLFVFKNTNAVFFGQWAAAGTGVKLVKNIFAKVLQMGWRREHPRVWLSDSQTAIREYVWLFLYSTVHKKRKRSTNGLSLSSFTTVRIWGFWRAEGSSPGAFAEAASLPGKQDCRVGLYCPRTFRVPPPRGVLSQASLGF